MTLEVVARNLATDSENRIHSDEVARKYGMGGGLVPGITVFGYMVTKEVLEGGPFRVRFVKPVYDGDRLTIRRQEQAITAERNRELCSMLTMGAPDFNFPIIGERPLPDRGRRPEATPEALLPGAVLGTIHGRLESEPAADSIPAALLGLANRALMDNFRLGPWMHVGSEVWPRGAIQWGDPITVCARIQERHEKKGRDFLVAEVQVESEGRAVQSIRHTVIYRM